MPVPVLTRPPVVVAMAPVMAVSPVPVTVSVRPAPATPERLTGPVALLVRVRLFVSVIVPLNPKAPEPESVRLLFSVTLLKTRSPLSVFQVWAAPTISVLLKVWVTPDWLSMPRPLTPFSVRLEPVKVSASVPLSNNRRPTVAAAVRLGSRNVLLVKVAVEAAPGTPPLQLPAVDQVVEVPPVQVCAVVCGARRLRASKAASAAKLLR